MYVQYQLNRALRVSTYRSVRNILLFLLPIQTSLVQKGAVLL